MTQSDTPVEQPGQSDQSAVDSNPEMVDVHEASIEDLDAALKDLQTQEKELESPELPESPVGTGTVEAKPTPTAKPPVAPAPQAPRVAATGAEASSPAKTYTQEEIQAILATQERQRKQLDEKESFIQRQGNELGKIRGEYSNARTQLLALKAQLSQGLEERFSENPLQASNDRDKIREIDQNIEALNNNEERAKRIVEAQTFFLRHVDTTKVTPDDIASLLKEVDGLDDMAVAQFKANPWEWAPPEALVQMGKRAQDRKDLLEADADRRLLAKHVLAQNAEIEKLKARPGQVISTLQRNLNRPAPVTAASTASPRQANSLDPSRIPYMSDQELSSALKHALNSN